MTKKPGIKLIILLTLWCLTTFAQDKKLHGVWDNEKGQKLVFNGQNQALWIFYSESKTDTFKIEYATDFSSKPFKLDLSGFSVGPLQGKTLFGIMEFIDKKTLKFDCEPGTIEGVRPKDFNPAQTQTYKRKNRT